MDFYGGSFARESFKSNKPSPAQRRGLAGYTSKESWLVAKSVEGGLGSEASS
jgi:hypothetical protein